MGLGRMRVAYALVWALVNDRVKLAAYWALDRADIRGEGKHEAHSGPDADGRAGVDSRSAPQPDDAAKAENRPTPQLVERVHHLYEELGREDVRAVEDWERKEKAVREATR